MPLSTSNSLTNLAGGSTSQDATGAVAAPSAAVESADAIAGRVSREQWDHYLTQFGGLEQQMVGDINSTKLVDETRNILGAQNNIARESFSRGANRYGVDPNSAKAKQMGRLQSFGEATNNTYSLNNARLEQRDRNLGLGGDLMQIGRGVAASGLQGLGDVAGMSAQRNAANAQAKAQGKAQDMATLGTIIGIGASFI